MSDVRRVAVVQASPRPFRREAALEEVARLAAEAAAGGARLALFPEAFVPAYPWGLIFGTRVGGRTDVGRSMFARYWDNSVVVPFDRAAATTTSGDPAVRAFHHLAAAARDAGIHLAVGIIERDADFSGGTLFCTLLHFGPDGRLLGRHRKLKPTAAERLIWGEGDGSTLPVVETELGRVGGLICWENYMPLARTAMYAKGVQVYLAPTADARDTWQATLRHIACEGRCFVLGCNQYVTRDMYPPDLPGIEELDGAPEVLCRGGSAIVGPLGEELAGPLYGRPGILYADLDPQALARAKFDFNVVGHYARPNVFRLRVNERRSAPVERRSGASAHSEPGGERSEGRVRR